MEKFKKKFRQWSAHLGVILVVVVWGSTFVSSKVLLNEGLMPADIFFYRFHTGRNNNLIYIFIIIEEITANYPKLLFSQSWRDELVFLGLGLMGGSLYFLTENMALVYSTSSNVSILITSCPMLTALIVGFFYRSERVNRKQFLGSVIAFVGMVMIVLNGQLILHLNPLGDMLALCAAFTWAFYSLLMKLVMTRYSTEFITRKVFFYGLLTILPYFWLVSPLNYDTAILSQPKILYNLLFLGFVASTGCYLLWNWVMRQLGAVKATNCLYLQSLVTMLVASIILGERITWMAILGTFILIFGMIRTQQ